MITKVLRPVFLVLAALCVAGASLSCQDPTGPSSIAVSVTSSGASDTTSTNFSVSWTCTNTGTVPAAIKYSGLAIHNGLGDLISFTQTDSNIVFWQFFNPGDSYGFTIWGKSWPAIACYYDEMLVFSDSQGNTSSYLAQSHDFELF
jgi:hypothetical protein